MSCKGHLLARLGKDLAEPWTTWPGGVMEKDGFRVPEFLCNEGLTLLRERIATHRDDG